MMIHFSFQYYYLIIIQNLFLSYLLLVDNSPHQHMYTGAPARTVGWRDPGFIHTSFLKELWPNRVYGVFFILAFDVDSRHVNS